MNKESRIPERYKFAVWRNTTGQDGNEIGIGFNGCDGITRLKISVNCARHLMKSIKESLNENPVQFKAMPLAEQDSRLRDLNESLRLVNEELNQPMSYGDDFQIWLQASETQKSILEAIKKEVEKPTE